RPSRRRDRPLTGLSRSRVASPRAHELEACLCRRLSCDSGPDPDDRATDRPAGCPGRWFAPLHTAHFRAMTSHLVLPDPVRMDGADHGDVAFEHRLPSFLVVWVVSGDYLETAPRSNPPGSVAFGFGLLLDVVVERLARIGHEHGLEA